MAVITTKELGSIGDQLYLEENLVRKFGAYAEQTNDLALKNKYQDMASRHQKHFDALYAQLK
ncbi:MAG: spore coat protein [Clostridia bacterium]|nr:spore coat protein [Clostridia bacterium]